MTTMTEDGVIMLEAIKARNDKPEKDPNKQYPYRLIPFEELRPGRTSPYIVDRLIPVDGLVAVWGPPKCGKSFWGFDLVMHIALGWEYRGRRVQQGPVVYCAFKGAQGFNDRAEAFRRTHAEALERNLAFKREWRLPEEIWFHLLASNAKLVRDHPALIESIDGQIDKPPTIVVLDTLNRSIDGSESKDQDMGAYLAAADAICAAFACVVIIVHHCGIDGTRPRGHTSLTGTAAVQIAVWRDDARSVVAQVEAMKDGPEGANFTSRLEVIEVGTNDLGKPITSCAIVPSDAAVVETGPKLTKTQQLAYDALNSPRLGGSNSTICMTPKNRRLSGRPCSAPPSIWSKPGCSCWPGNMSTCRASVTERDIYFFKNVTRYRRPTVYSNPPLSRAGSAQREA